MAILIETPQTGHPASPCKLHTQCAILQEWACRHGTKANSSRDVTMHRPTSQQSSGATATAADADSGADEVDGHTVAVSASLSVAAAAAAVISLTECLSVCAHGMAHCQQKLNPVVHTFWIPVVTTAAFSSHARFTCPR